MTSVGGLLLGYPGALSGNRERLGKYAKVKFLHSMGFCCVNPWEMRVYMT